MDVRQLESCALPQCNTRYCKLLCGKADSSWGAWGHAPPEKLGLSDAIILANFENQTDHNFV